MTILTTPLPTPASQTAVESKRPEHRWHVLSIATLVVATVAAALSLVAVLDSDRDAVQTSPPAVVVAPQTPGRTANATSIQDARDVNAAKRYRTLDACGRPIVAGRQSCD
jgi:hypothetical protein